MESKSDFTISISNMKTGKDIKELYKAQNKISGKDIRLFFAGREIGDQTPLYKLKLANGHVIIVFII